MTARRTSTLLLACALGLSLSTAALAAPTPGPNPNSNNNGNSGNTGSNNSKNSKNSNSSGTNTGGSGSSSGTSQSQGNAGTIKIAFPGDGSAPNNDAKPGCVVRLDFYGFRTGTYRAVFRAIAPTGSKQLASGNVTVTQPRTPASRLQTSQRFTLDVSGLTPSNQGYHVNVKVTNPANPGNGGKTKNFYFDCVPANAAEFTGGSGSLTLASFGGGGGGVSRAPAGGFATGVGGPVSTDVPILPLTGLLAGLALVAAGALSRRRV